VKSAFNNRFVRFFGSFVRDRRICPALNFDREYSGVLKAFPVFRGTVSCQKQLFWINKNLHNSEVSENLALYVKSFIYERMDKVYTDKK